VCIASIMGKHVRERPKMRLAGHYATAMKVCAALQPLHFSPRVVPDADWRAAPQFADGSFDTVVDKGALDALMGEAGRRALRKAQRCLRSAAAWRTRRAAPWRWCSLLQDHVLEALLHTFRAGWRLSIRQVPPSRDMLTSPLQPFFVLRAPLLTWRIMAGPMPTPRLTQPRCHPRRWSLRFAGAGPAARAASSTRSSCVTWRCWWRAKMRPRSRHSTRVRASLRAVHQSCVC
jgi:hypothetical protein